MTSRNGRPADLLDQTLADLRRIWGDQARIDITEDGDGNYIITVFVRNQSTWGSGLRVDTRTITPGEARGC